MSLWSRVRDYVGSRSPGSSTPAGAAEGHSGRPEGKSREPGHEAADQHSTTGTTADETFVGRVAGDDPGYLETGAEKRAEPDAGRGGEPGRPDRR